MLTTTTSERGGLTIHIHTQYLENYGTADRPHWKFKGGDTFVVTGFNHPLNDRIGAAAAEVVAKLHSQIEYANDASEVHFLDWNFAPEGALTQWEQDQQEFDGKITDPSPRVAVQ